jgi:uncharacterized protein YqgV (UPF0045/DUF77 family)
VPPEERSGAVGTAVEGDLEQILAALRGIHGRLSTEGIDFELHVRLRQGRRGDRA